jgi:hypothetical protein
MNAMQLLYHQAPWSAVILLLLIPVFEPVSTTITVHWTAAVVVSCQHTLTSIWHCAWQHMVVLYCHLHYSYSHLYLLVVESQFTEGCVHEQQHLHYTGWSKNLYAPDDYNTIVRFTEIFGSPCTLCSELYMCPCIS